MTRSRQRQLSIATPSGEQPSEGHVNSPTLIFTPDSDCCEAYDEGENNFHDNCASRESLNVDALQLALRQLTSQLELQVSKSSSFASDVDPAEISGTGTFLPLQQRDSVSYTKFGTSATCSSSTNKGCLGPPGPVSTLSSHEVQQVCGAHSSRKYGLGQSKQCNPHPGLISAHCELPALLPYFIPRIASQLYEESTLSQFVSQRVHKWGDVESTLRMTCGYHRMPYFSVMVHEFEPSNSNALARIHYVSDSGLKEMTPISTKSTALGIVNLEHRYQKICDDYISEIVDKHLDNFSGLCWREDSEDFLPKIFRLMMSVPRKNKEEIKLFREVFRLIVVTFIMSHSLTIAKEEEPSNYPKFSSPRILNRQLKHVFSHLRHSIFSLVLDKLQQILKSSQGHDEWTAAFITVLGMCMALEDEQKTTHLIMSTQAATTDIDARFAQEQAENACRDIDKHMMVVIKIFCSRFHYEPPSKQDSDHGWNREANLGASRRVEFVRQVTKLIRDNTDYLCRQRKVNISSKNQREYSVRLVAQLLSSVKLSDVS